MAAFFFATWIGRAVLAVIVVIIAVVALAGVMAGLAVSGGPGDCEPGGAEPIVVSDANSNAFQQKWDTFQTNLDAGSPDTVTFNESEVTSRAVVWIREEDGPDFEDARICIHDGFGEATGSLGAIGLDVEFKITGSAELTPTRIVVQIDDIDLGNIPDPLLGPLESQIEDPIEDALDDIDLGGHTYTVTLTEGMVTVDGQP